MNKHLHHYKRILALLLSLVMLASVPMQTMAESAQISLENETAESEIGHSHESEDQALTESEDLTDTDTISDVSETDVEEIPDETFVDEAEEETSIDETVEEVSVDETIEEESVTETEDNENVILSSGKHFCCYCDEWKDDSDFSFCGNANDDSFCTDCLQGWGIHCEDCDKCKYDDEDDFCIMCHKCRDCWDEDEHCSECNRETDLVCEDCGKCYDCVTADRCYECHLCPDCWDEDEHCKTCKSHGDVCSSCGRCEECVESHHYHCSLCDGCLKGGEVEYCNTCGDTNDDDVHCQKCIEGTDECCNNCGLHMLSDKTSFICSEYNYCGECALIEGIHCPNCIEAHVECEDCGLCENCIEELETHCPDCSECYGPEGYQSVGCADGGEHCLECCANYGWLCPECGGCTEALEMELCPDCGLCELCCALNVQGSGCTCGEYCIESGDFPEHFCKECGTCFDEAEQCEYCGLCSECCADDACPDCGLCSYSDEYEDHYCPECDTCMYDADYCDICGLCIECCTLNQEAQGNACSDGMCVEDSDYEEHFCEICGECFHQVDGCALCFEEGNRICYDCCEGHEDEDEDENEDELVKERYVDSSLPEILRQPKDVVAYATDTQYGIGPAAVSNTVTLSVRVRGTTKYTYQWQFLSKSSTATWKNLTSAVPGGILEGAESNTVTFTVPDNLCSNGPVYLRCVIRNSSRGVVITRTAKVTGEHYYARWKTLSEGSNIHAKFCTGKNCSAYSAASRGSCLFNTWTVVTAPTDTVNGTSKSTCTVCGNEKTVEIPAKHDHVWRWAYQDEADDIYVCTVEGCGEVKKNAMPNCLCFTAEDWLDMGDNVTMQSANDSYHNIICKLCGRVIEKRKHEIVEDDSRYEAPTEKNTGKMYLYCAELDTYGCEYSCEVVVPKKDHIHDYLKGTADYSRSHFVSNNTYDAYTHWRICEDKVDGKVCGYVYGRESHNWGSWTLPHTYMNSTDDYGRQCVDCGIWQYSPAVEYELAKKVCANEQYYEQIDPKLLKYKNFALVTCSGTSIAVNGTEYGVDTPAAAFIGDTITLTKLPVEGKITCWHYLSADNVNYTDDYDSSTYTFKLTSNLITNFRADCGSFLLTKSCPHTSSTHLDESTYIEPSCRASGFNAGYVCDTCGLFLGQGAEIAAVGHDWVPVPETIVESSCSQRGYEGDMVCSRCGETKRGQKLEKLEHTYGEVELVIEPTCYMRGRYGRRCARCGKVQYTESIDKLSHTFKYVAISAETHKGVCTVCGHATTAVKHNSEGTCLCGFSNEKIVSLKLVSKPAKLKYYPGEVFDSTGLQVKASYADKTSTDASAYCDITGFDSSTAGTKNITVSVTSGGVTQKVSFKITVVGLSTFTLTRIPSKTIYAIGENLGAASTLLAKATLTDNSTRTISFSSLKVDDSAFDNSKPGTYPIKVSYTYGGKTLSATYKVTVVSSFNPATGVTVSGKGVTEIAQNRYSINLCEGVSASLSAVLTTANGKPATGKVSWMNENPQLLSVSGGKIKALKTGTGYITIYSSDSNVQLATVRVIVVGKGISKMKIDHQPDQRYYYVGDSSLNPEGGTVKVTYIDGSTGIISMTDAGFSFTGFSSGTTGSKTISAVYDLNGTSAKVSFKINVLANTTTKADKIVVKNGSGAVLKKEVYNGISGYYVTLPVGNTISLSASLFAGSTAVTSVKTRWNANSTHITVNGGSVADQTGTVKIAGKKAGRTTLDVHAADDSGTGMRIHILVAPRGIKKLEILRAPARNIYELNPEEGTVPADLTDLYLKATYTDGSTESGFISQLEAVDSGITFSDPVVDVHKAGTVSVSITATSGGTFATASYKVKVSDAYKSAETLQIVKNGMGTSDIKVAVGQTLPVSATLTYYDGTRQEKADVRWTSGNSCVAVEGEKLIAKSTGDTILVADARDGSGATDYLHVTVIKKAVKKIQILKLPTRLIFEKGYDYGEDVDYKGLEVKVTYTDGSTEIVTIDQGLAKIGYKDLNGKVSTVLQEAGTVTSRFAVSVPGTDEVYGSYKITVVDSLNPVSSITLTENGEKRNGGTVFMTKGRTTTLKAKASAMSGTPTTTGITWRSSDESIATVSNGKIKAIKAGTVTITAYSGDSEGVSASCTVDIVAGGAKKVVLQLEPVRKTYNVGESFTADNLKGALLTLTLTDGSTISNIPVTTSELVDRVALDASISAVDMTTAGKKTINIKTVKGGLSAYTSFTFKVVAAVNPVTDIKLSESVKSMYVGEKLTLKAQVTSNGTATDKSVRWSSSRESVATVTSDGKVSMKGVGIALIYAEARDGSGKKDSMLLIVLKKSSAVNMYLNGTKLTKSGTTVNYSDISSLYADTNGTDNKVIWKSSAESVLMVDDSGNLQLGTVTTKKTVTLTAVPNDKGKASFSIKVIVAP